MHLHYLQHVPFEGLGSLEPLFRARGHRLSHTRLFAGERLPDAGDFDGLIVMGGPMGVGDEAQFPWLADEKRLIRQSLDEGRPILGICLGAQLIATCLGASVGPGTREIGWFPVERSGELADSHWASVLPPTFEAFHWHSDTFAIPGGALPVGASGACANQGFIMGRVLALQFHLETTPESARALIEHCPEELNDGGPHVQDAVTLLSNPGRFETINGTMTKLVDRWLAT